MIPLRVLILEDRPSDAQLMLHELRNCGFEPQWERVDTEEEYVSRLAPTVDVILADHSMPRFNSIRALELLQERQLDIPFIVVSGAIGEDVAVCAMKAGATDYLLKDRLARLGPAVTQAVRQHTLRNEKRRVEQRLMKAEALLRRQLEFSSAITNHVGEGVCAVDTAGCLTFLNPAAERILGWRAGELLGQSLHDAVHRSAGPGENAAMLCDAGCQLYTALRSGSTVPTADDVFVRKSGSTFPVAYVCTPILTEGEATGAVIAFHDITERTRADEALRQYAERLNILRQIDQATLAAQSPEAVANAVLARLREVVPCQLATVVLFDFGEQAFTILAVHTRGDPRRGEPQLPAGTRLPLAAYGELHVEALRGQKVHTAEDILHLFSAPPTIELLPPQQRHAAINLPLIAEGKLMGALNLVADAATSFDARHLEITREITHPLAVAMHQTQLRQQLTQYTIDLKRRVAARTAELQQSNAELEAFAYTVSHDLRAPLRAMQGFADALLEDYASVLDDTARDHAQRIVGAAQRMDRLIQDVLAYSQVGFGQLQLTPVELDAVLADVLAQLDAELCRRGAAVVCEPLPAVIGHRATLAQALANLLANAVKFVAPGVQPQIRIWATNGTVLRNAAPATISHSSVRVWIEDNGIGIAPEYCEKIFGVFERLHTPSTYPGNGIGLAIVRKAITRMGGCVGVESHVATGSRFWIELQRADT